MLRPGFVLALAVVLTTPVAADPLHATIVDGQTLEPIRGATARIGDREVSVDALGRLDLGELDRDVVVAVSAPGYEPGTQTIARHDDGALVLLFRPHALDEVVEIRAQAPRAATDSAYVLGKDEIRSLPGGSTDALAAVRSLPGVAAAPSAAGGRLVIRGGAPQDSLLTIDGVPVPFAYHSFDNTTILPLSMVGSIAYSPGGFGVDDGRATSGTVGIITNDVPPERAGGQVSISMLDASAFGATPLSTRHGLYLSGGLRRSTVDLLIPIAVPESAMVGFTTPPLYYDGQLRLDWIAGAHDRVTLLGLTSFDQLGIVNHMAGTDLPADFEQHSQFGRLIASWKHETPRVRNRMVAALGTGDSHARFDTIQHVDDANNLALVRDDLSIDAHRLLRVRAGAFAEIEHNDLDARSIVVSSDGLPPGHFGDIPIKTLRTSFDANYAAAYAAGDLRLTSTTTLTVGTRVDYFAHIQAAVVEPRAELAQKVGAMTLHAAAGRYARDFNQTEGIPTNLLPERATQLSGGTDIDLGDGLTATASVYHTSRSQLAVADSSRMSAPDELLYTSAGSGTSAGVDLLLRLHRDHVFGWLGYSFGKSSRRDDPTSASHATPFDQTHTLTAVASYRIGAWQLGARFQYTSGLPYTDVVGATHDDSLDRYLPVLGAPFGARYPDVAQLDLRVEHVWKTRVATIAAFVDVGNVFRQARIERYTYSSDFSSRAPLEQYIPLPSIGVRGEL